MEKTEFAVALSSEDGKRFKVVNKSGKGLNMIFYNFKFCVYFYVFFVSFETISQPLIKAKSSRENSYKFRRATKCVKIISNFSDLWNPLFFMILMEMKLVLKKK